MSAIHRSLTIAVLIVAGCNMSPAYRVSAPAPQAAAACAVAKASELGFEPSEGGPGGAAVQFARKVVVKQAERPADVSRAIAAALVARLLGRDPPVAAGSGSTLVRPEAELLTVEQDAGALRVEVIGILKQKPVRPSPDGQAAARAIIAACGGGGASPPGPDGANPRPGDAAGH